MNLIFALLKQKIYKFVKNRKKSWDGNKVIPNEGKGSYCIISENKELEKENLKFGNLSKWTKRGRKK